MRPNVVGIRFQEAGKIYHFDASNCRDIEIGDHAVVETSRGSQIGEVVQVLEGQTSQGRSKWKPIKRKATPRDMVLRQILRRKEAEAVNNCRSKAAELGLEGIKIVSAEYSFGGSKLIFFYNSGDDKEISIKGLRSAMRRTYSRVRVNFRQIGPRDVAKVFEGMGACGMEKRCCSKFLTEFCPISIKMAKTQNVSLSPSEITGMCGRLRCCLGYEYKQYKEARRLLPKKGTRVDTPLGKGKVVEQSLIKKSVMVELESNVKQEFQFEEIEILGKSHSGKRRGNKKSGKGKRRKTKKRKSGRSKTGN